MQSSRLAVFPAENREDIYTFVLLQAKGIVAFEPVDDSAMNVDQQYLDLKPHLDTPNALALTQTCRAIRVECADLFYKVNIFPMPGNVFLGTALFFAKVLGILGKQHETSLRKVELEIEDPELVILEGELKDGPHHSPMDEWSRDETIQQLTWLRQCCLLHIKAGLKVSFTHNVHEWYKTALCTIDLKNVSLLWEADATIRPWATRPQVVDSGWRL